MNSIKKIAHKLIFNIKNKEKGQTYTYGDNEKRVQSQAVPIYWESKDYVKLDLTSDTDNTNLMNYNYYKYYRYNKAHFTNT